MGARLTTQALLGGRARRWRTWGPIVAISAAALLAIPWMIGPACPQYVVLATGGADGSYYAFGRQYRDMLAKKGITLDVRSTTGSVENIELLRSAQSNVSLAIVQAGTAPPDSLDELESLASLYLEPLWVFCRGEDPIDRLDQLKGKSIAIGPQGSGTRAVAMTLLDDNELRSATRLVDWTGIQAADGLMRGEIDAAMFVVSPRAPAVRRLLHADGIQLMNFRRATAYRRRYPFFSSVTLSEGMIDLTKNIPSRDIVLLAPAANLVARRGAHPALVSLLLKAATRVHESGGLFAEPGAFPTAHHAEYPLNEDARRYLHSGPSLLYRCLPFRLAAWLDRVKLALIPMLTILLPLLKTAPPIYRWSIRSKIYRWYRVLREIDQKLKESKGVGDFSADVATLDELDRELAEVSVPLSYMEEFYNLRVHVSLVRDNLLQRQQAPPRRLVA